MKVMKTVLMAATTRPGQPAEHDGGHFDPYGSRVTGVPEGDLYDWWQRGISLLEHGDAAAAATLLQHAVEADPTSASAWEALGRARYDAGQIPQAAAAFAQLLELAPHSHYAHFALGLSLTRINRFEQGVEHLAMASAMRPDLPEYVDRLRQARATLRARQQTSDPSPTVDTDR